MTEHAKRTDERRAQLVDEATLLARRLGRHGTIGRVVEIFPRARSTTFVYQLEGCKARAKSELRLLEVPCELRAVGVRMRVCETDRGRLEIVIPATASASAWLADEGPSRRSREFELYLRRMIEDNCRLGARDRQLYIDALVLILFWERCSISLLQRELGLGFNTAIGLIEVLTRVGVIGDPEGGLPDGNRAVRTGMAAVRLLAPLRRR